MQGLMLWLVLGGVIIAALAGYAGFLLVKLHRQNKREQAFKQHAIAKRNDNILESVFIIAQAGLEDQCDLSEISIRLYKLMEVLQSDKAVDFEVRFPAMFELYQVVKDMPRGEARRQYSRKEIMKFDLERMKAEARLQDSIKQELEAVLAMKRA